MGKIQRGFIICVGREQRPVGLEEFTAIFHKDIEDFTIVQRPHLIFKYRSNAADTIQAVNWSNDANPTIREVEFEVFMQPIARFVNIKTQTFDEDLLQRIIKTYKIDRYGKDNTEPLDGDETEDLTKILLKELDKYQGND